MPRHPDVDDWTQSVGLKRKPLTFRLRKQMGHAEDLFGKLVPHKALGMRGTGFHVPRLRCVNGLSIALRMQPSD